MCWCNWSSSCIVLDFSVPTECLCLIMRSVTDWEHWQSKHNEHSAENSLRCHYCVRRMTHNGNYLFVNYTHSLSLTLIQYWYSVLSQLNVYGHLTHLFMLSSISFTAERGKFDGNITRTYQNLIWNLLWFQQHVVVQAGSSFCWVEPKNSRKST